MNLRRVFAICAVLALALGIGCELLISVDGLDDQQCSAHQKPCPNLKRCVSIFEPDTGCGLAHCGPCAPANATARCTETGECVKAGCIPPYEDCNDQVPGCETDLAHDPMNCNGCGIRCETPHGYPGCSEKNCKTGGCERGFADCDGQVPNGCEINILMDDKNCGACRQPCPDGTTCTQGTCG